MFRRQMSSSRVHQAQSPWADADEGSKEIAALSDIPEKVGEIGTEFLLVLDLTRSKTNRFDQTYRRAC